MKKETSIPVLKAHSLKKATHGFFTRQGGVSKGMYESLNCSFRDKKELEEKDSKENVLENRKLALGTLGLTISHLCTLTQVHGDKVVVAKNSPKTPPKADALVTKSSDLILGIQTADCVPVLLLDATHKIVGAAHAGWRGALKGVIQKTIEAMEELGGKPQSIFAALGPCINQESYEMGPEVYEAFLEQDSENEEFFQHQDHPKKILFDLPGYVESRLKKAGVSHIERLPYCTYEQEDLFFSCRRATHRHQKGFGGHLSLISLQGM